MGLVEICVRLYQFIFFFKLHIISLYPDVVHHHPVNVAKTPLAVSLVTLINQQ